jgi:hypothetical protein
MGKFKSVRVTLGALVAGALLFSAGIVKANDDFRSPRRSQNRSPGAGSVNQSRNYDTSRAPAQNDADLVRAVNDRRNVNFVQAGNVVVSKILPDDTTGLPHQKWYIKLSNGKQVIAIYNSDMGKRIPMKVGTVMALGGEFKMTNIGPLIHWLHFDPRGSRPDGYVIVDGVLYGGK